MRVLHLIQRQQLRGAEVFTCQLCHALKEVGDDCKVVSLFAGDAEMPHGIRVDSLDRQLSARVLDRSGWRQLAAVIKEFRPDVVQCNAGDTLKYAVFSKLLHRWKAPILVRNASMVSSYIRRRWTLEFNRFLYSRVSGVAAVSGASAADLTSMFNLDGRPVRVLPIAVEKQVVSPVELSPDFSHIVHVGGFSFEKNHRGLLRIFKSVLSSISNARLHLVGDGPLRSEVESYCRELGLTDMVTFHGFQKKPMAIIKAATVFVLPSIIEGLPAVLLEAMSVGVPVVAYDVGGISEIVKSGWNGCLISCNDEQRFSESVISTIVHNDQRLIANGLQLVEENYTMAKVMQGFREFYQELSSASH